MDIQAIMIFKNIFLKKQQPEKHALQDFYSAYKKSFTKLSAIKQEDTIFIASGEIADAKYLLDSHESRNVIARLILKANGDHAFNIYYSLEYYHDDTLHSSCESIQEHTSTNAIFEHLLSWHCGTPAASKESSKRIRSFIDATIHIYYAARLINAE
ncbi:hypothetical protein LMH73_013835 [Vibrio splendidus]|nr:hypothetical protein [Vibrio splendidus]MCC4883068.1 hypothetical protein [Vibrio splendidus]